MINDNFGDRMKAYEAVTDVRLTGLTPVILRVDGKSFHTLTAKINKPFDGLFMQVMNHTALELCRQIPNCRFGYVQSDEISLVLLEPSVCSEQWFNGRLQKMTSIAASIASTEFRMNLLETLNVTKDNPEDWAPYTPLVKNALFDCRAFNIPEMDVCNYFIWRQKDCRRNAILSMAQHHIGKKNVCGIDVSGLTARLHSMGFSESDIPSLNGRSCIKAKKELKRTDGSVFTRAKWDIVENVPVFSSNRIFVEKHLEIKE
jgi:tRNA(His) 5'-end guanylyltransferase